jgi:hypothetical protein
MEPDIKQDLSLLPGDYYHPEAAYASASYPDGTLLWRGHRIRQILHGIWEEYYKDGTLERRRHYLHGKLHGLWEHYWTDGTPEKLAWHSEGNRIPFFIEVLLGISILDI